MLRQQPSIPTVKFKLTIAYDGTNYEGWQVQKTGTGVQQKSPNAPAIQLLRPALERLGERRHPMQGDDAETPRPIYGQS